MTKIDIQQFYNLRNSDLFRTVSNLICDITSYDKNSKNYNEALAELEKMLVDKTDDEKTLVLMAICYGIGYDEAAEKYY